MSENTFEIVPVLPSQDIARDIKFYTEQAGFKLDFGDDMYAGMSRDGIHFHLQWHADTEDDPLLGGSVMKIFVDDLEPIYREFLERGTITPERLRRDTPWGTNEFGFYDLNHNAVFFVQDV